MKTDLNQHNSIKHIAIIMDGNGRWAQFRSRPRVWGHVRGASVVSDIVEKATKLPINALTLFAFSTENFKRPEIEKNVLYKLLYKFLKKERAKILENNVCFNVIGETETLDQKTKSLINQIKEETQFATGLKLSFAFGYGGRREIADAFNSIVSQKDFEPRKKITEQDISNHLYDDSLGDVDLLIRTGGDHRISNFLLWQSAYAELYFSNTLWPDFSDKEFEEIYRQVCLRERRFGAVGSPVCQTSREVSLGL